jgi:hypothetical protein
MLYNDYFPFHLVNSLLESYKYSINRIEDGQSLEQKQNYLPSLSLGKKYYITNLKKSKLRIAY